MIKLKIAHLPLLRNKYIVWFDILYIFDRKYSAQGWTHPSSYSYTHVKPYGNYTVVAMDATPNPGPRRPFNFLGILNKVRNNSFRSFPFIYTN